MKTFIEHIVKLKSGKYRLLSHKGKNLGTFDSHAAAAKHEGEVEYFKAHEETIREDAKLAPADGNVKSESDYLYHATNVERAHDIAKEGLKPFPPHYGTDQVCWPDGHNDKRVYFSAKAHTVWQFAPEEGKSCILRVPKKLGIFRQEVGTGDVFCRVPVAPRNIEIMKADGTWMPLTQLNEATLPVSKIL